MSKLKMNIVRSVEIEPITEEYIAELLRKDIESQLPEGAHIKKIEFQRRLNPQRIEAEVTAFFGAKPAVVAEEKIEAVKEELADPIVEELLATAPAAADVFSAPAKAESEPEEAETVIPSKVDIASLFG